MHSLVDCIDASEKEQDRAKRATAGRVLPLEPGGAAAESRCTFDEPCACLLRLGCCPRDDAMGIPRDGDGGRGW